MVHDPFAIDGGAQPVGVDLGVIAFDGHQPRAAAGGFDRIGFINGDVRNAVTVYCAPGRGEGRQGEGVGARPRRNQQGAQAVVLENLPAQRLDLVRVGVATVGRQRPVIDIGKSLKQGRACPCNVVGSEVHR